MPERFTVWAARRNNEELLDELEVYDRYTDGWLYITPIEAKELVALLREYVQCEC